MPPCIERRTAVKQGTGLGAGDTSPRRASSGDYNNMKKAIVSIAFGLTASLLATGASAQATLNSVKQKGYPDLRIEHRPCRLRRS